MQSLESGTSTARVEKARASFFARYRASAAVLAVLLVIIGLATSWNLQGWPGRVDDDEGTYVAQAWAIIYEHTLTHYSYWYDHPPLGWMQIALFAWVTDGFNRVASAVFVGRQFMVLVTLISCALLWLLCRRLAMRRTTSAITVLLFGLSPLGQYFHRLVSLDNIETMWVLAALVCAASPRRGWGPAWQAALCAAFAVLSKETALLFLPIIAWVLLQHTGTPEELAADEAARPAASSPPDQPDQPAHPAPAVDRDQPPAPVTASNDAELPVWKPDWSAFASRHTREFEALRSNASSPGAVLRSPAGLSRASAAALRVLPPWGQRLAIFAATGCVIVAIYPIYAIQRGQLGLLWSTLQFQFFNRPGSGSLLNSSTVTYSMVHGWVLSDPWLLVSGFIAALLMLFSQRLRPISIALLLEIVILIKGSYLPFFYVTAILPFAALLIGGAADTVWDLADPGPLARLRSSLPAWGRRWRWPLLGPVVVVIVGLVFAVHVAPEWAGELNTNSTANGDAPYLSAVTWAEKNVPKGSVVVVDDYLWVDLKRQNMDPLWLWKITPQTAPTWKTINYIILQPQSAGTLASMPSLQGAYAHSVQVADFGNGLTARKVTGG